MADTASLVSEIKSLCSHIEDINAEMSKKGFTMAGDTKLRLSEADKLLGEEEYLKPGTKAEEEWISKAEAMADVLRSEAGHSFVKA